MLIPIPKLAFCLTRSDFWGGAPPEVGRGLKGDPVEKIKVLHPEL